MNVGNPLQNLTLAFSETGGQALALSGTLKELDTPLGDLARTNLPAAIEQFSSWAAEMGASDEQVLTLLNNLPTFRQAIEEQVRQPS